MPATSYLSNVKRAAKNMKPLVRQNASAYLRHKGFEDVNQLHGGIIDYARQIKEQELDSKFIGKNFVFDERLKPADPQDLQSYVQGANAGDPIASFYLGYMLVHQPDADARLLRQAARAFDTSARKGIPASMANLGLMMFDGRGVLQDFTEGYAWLTIAASSGLPDVVDMRDGLAASMTIDQINAAQAMAEKLWNEIQGGPE